MVYMPSCNHTYTYIDYIHMPINTRVDTFLCGWVQNPPTFSAGTLLESHRCTGLEAFTCEHTVHSIIYFASESLSSCNRERFIVRSHLTPPPTNRPTVGMPACLQWIASDGAFSQHLRLNLHSVRYRNGRWGEAMADRPSFPLGRILYLIKTDVHDARRG